MPPGLLACLQALGLVSTCVAQALHAKELSIKYSGDLVTIEPKGLALPYSHFPWRMRHNVTLQGSWKRKNPWAWHTPSFLPAALLLERFCCLFFSGCQKAELGTRVESLFQEPGWSCEWSLFVQ